MTAGWTPAEVVTTLVFAATLFALETALSVALLAATALSRVALRRMSNGTEPGLAFLEQMRDPGSTHRTAAALLRQVCLLGGVALSALAAWGAGLGSPAVAAVTAAAVLGALLIETFVARMLALWNPRRALRWTAPLVRLAHGLLYPLVQPLRLALLRWSPARPPSDEEREEQQDEEVDALIEVGERAGILEANEGRMMRSIVDLDETLVREIMTPRTDIVALGEGTSVAEARRVVIDAGHSRIPVYRGSIDNIVGFLHERDLLRASAEDRGSEAIAALVRPVIFVPETLSVADLLGEMKQRKHFGMVVDEYGGVSGLVTLEDVLEEIVGEIRDEHDTEESLVRADPDGSWIIDASAHVEELEERFGLEFGERDFDTVGGFVVTGFGRVPTVGEVLAVQGVQIEVLEADRRRIRLVRLRPAAAPGEIRVGT